MSAGRVPAYPVGAGPPRAPPLHHLRARGRRCHRRRRRRRLHRRGAEFSDGQGPGRHQEEGKAGRRGAGGRGGGRRARARGGGAQGGRGPGPRGSPPRSPLLGEGVVAGRGPTGGGAERGNAGRGGEGRGLRAERRRKEEEGKEGGGGEPRRRTPSAARVGVGWGRGEQFPRHREGRAEKQGELWVRVGPLRIPGRSGRSGGAETLPCMREAGTRLLGGAGSPPRSLQSRCAPGAYRRRGRWRREKGSGVSGPRKGPTQRLPGSLA